MGGDRLGDESGFDEFVVAVLPELRRLGYMLTRSVATSDDLSQFALVKVFAAWPRVSSMSSAGRLAYARRIVVNAHIGWWRRWSSRVVLGGVADRVDVDDPVAEWAERDRLVAALGELSPRQRAVVVLRYQLGMSEAETAQALGCRVGTVKSAGARALERLRRSLESDTEAPVQEVQS